MKKILFFLLSLLTFINVSAVESEYIPLVREGVKWEYVLYKNTPGYKFNPDYEMLYTLEFNGTTTIEEDNGDIVEYSNLYRTDHESVADITGPILVGLIKEENKVVKSRKIDFNDFPSDYYGMFYSWTPSIVYDFNNPLFLMIEDPQFTDFFNGYDISEIEEEIGGSIRKGYLLSGNSTLTGETIKIVEGIGIDCLYGDLLVPYRDFTTGGNSPAIKSKVDDIAELMGDTMVGLSAVYENGQLVYKGQLYEEAQKLKSFDPIDAVATVKTVSSVRYYNLAGVESAEPLDGVSIKVTTYADGTRKCEKVVR